MRRAVAVAIALVFLGAPAAAQTGLLVVAHGAAPGWNEGVRQVVAQVGWEGPVATAFLMGSGAKTSGWAQGVSALVRGGAREIVVVPLMVSSYGGHYRQIRYYAGEIPAWPADLVQHEHGEVAPPPVPMRVTAALDGAAELGDVLLDRWRSLEEKDRSRPLLFLAHGPSSDEESAQWTRDLEAAVAAIASLGKIRVAVGLLRDDAPAPVRAAAIAAIHAKVAELTPAAGDSVAVLPVLISSGNIDAVTIPKDLRGLPVRYSPRSLAPHPALARWIERVALAKAAARP